MADAVVLFIAATFLAKHQSVPSRVLGIAVLVWSGIDLLWALWLGWRSSSESEKAIGDHPRDETGSESDAELSEIYLSAPKKREWIVYPDLATGGVEVELRIDGRRHVAKLDEGEWAAVDAVVRDIDSKVQAEATRIELNSALARVLGRKPFVDMGRV